jgi:hypothetical protein
MQEPDYNVYFLCFVKERETDALTSVTRDRVSPNPQIALVLPWAVFLGP